MSELTEFRQAKDHFMGHDHDSPLTDEQKGDFHGLNYYDGNDDLRLTLDMQEYENPEVIDMQTSTGDVTQYLRWAKIAFNVDGEPAELTVYKDAHGHGYFLPFADATSGSETYGAGRYLEIDVMADNKAMVDFNFAYNPYCAYNESWSCPLTPFENRLKVPIQAGEKNFK